MTRGILAYGSYVPYNRLQRSKISSTLGQGGGRGTRSVASYDEDTTSMGVEAARQAMSSSGAGNPGMLTFATTVPAYLDKTNANTIHAALGLAPTVLTSDMIGGPRSASGAVIGAISSMASSLVVASDIRTGMPGGADEANGGDAAVALLIGGDDDGPLLAQCIGGGFSAGEFLDRWRSPGDRSSKVWEERFGETAYLPHVETAVEMALGATGTSPEAVDKVILTGVHPRAVRASLKAIAVNPDKVVDDLSMEVGYTGAAHAWLLLAHVLDTAEPGEVIMVVELSDGATVSLFRTTEALASGRPSRSVRAQIDAGNDSLEYAAFLTWRGEIVREPPRRPDPDRPAGPPSNRTADWKFAFVGTQCNQCGARHLPPARVCVKCRSVDDMTEVSLADSQATIATYTVDRLAYSLAPPVVAAVLDFDGGGRFTSEMTDVDAADVKIGNRVEMTFRRLYVADGVHNYFWKARPVV